MGTIDFVAKALGLLMWISLVLGATPTFAQSDTTSPVQNGLSPVSSITGTIVDQDGAVIASASITLTQPGQPQQFIRSGKDGTFTFSNAAAGPFELTVEATGFATSKTTGTLPSGEPYWAPPIQLAAAARIEVSVAETQEQIAEEQIHVEEEQRVLKVFPNYYVTYTPDAAPLNVRQKYQLAWKASINPFSFGIAALFAGLEQGGDYYSGYGEGMQGYGKRLGATYADSVIGTFIGGAILPSVFKQDPRYFYKGTGTKKSRLAYALSNAVICKGDNGRWQPNYSSMLGGLAAGAISNLYYPASNRSGVRLTFVNGLIAIGGTAAAAVSEEFLLRHLTPHKHDAPLSAQ